MSKNEISKISSVGMKTAINYFIKEGYSVDDVSKKRGPKFRGYDLLVEKNGKKLKIEVKTSRKKRGIPDSHSNEFVNGKIVADFFYIVRLDQEKKPLCIEILSKSDVNKYSKYHKIKTIYKISSKLKTDLSHGRVGKRVKL